MPNAVVLIISLLSVVEFGDVVAGNPASQANAKQSCLAATTDELSYRAAVERVSLVPMVKTWRASLGAQGRMALGGHIFDKTEFINGRCYWSISFYESDPAQQRLWKIFRVDVKAKGIFVMDDDGDYLPIYPPAQLK
ncbi:MAG: hypothetical protein EPN89_01335 [Methylovulum sp.]|nr:MAG: hypothetical protein EPN89_01335 [Methylovulum sp.]